MFIVVYAAEPAKLYYLENIFNNVIWSILSMVGIVFFLLIIAGGFQFITAGGDPKKAAQAKNTLTYALLGFVFVSLSFLIIRFIQDFTGINVSLFQLSYP